MSSRSGSSRRKAHVAVRLRDSNKDDDNDDDAAELSGSDNDNKEEGSDEAVPELPEGTVIVNPEPVDDSDESKSSRNSRRSNQTSSFSSSSTLLERVCCTSCNKQMNPHNEGAIRRHKLLKVLQCKKCYKYLKSGEITQDEDGLDEQCCWCGEGGRLYGCDFCHHTFCRACIMRNFGRAEATKLEADGGKWKCYICDRSKIAEKREYGNKVLDMIEKIQQKERERERAARRKAKAAASKEGTPASSDKNSSSASNQKEKEKGASRKSLPAPVKSLPAPVKLKSAAIINDGSRKDNQVLVVKQNPHPPNPVNLVSKTLYQPVQSRAITAHKMILPKPTLSSDILMAHMQRPYNPAMHRPVEQMPMVSLEQMQGRSNNSSPTPFGADVPKNNTEQLKKNVNQGNVAEMVDKMKTVSASLSLMLNSISTDLEICQLQRQNMRLAKEKACLSLRDGIDGLFSNVREIFNVSISATTDGVAAATNGKDSKVSLVSSSTPIGKKEAIIHPSPIKNGNLDVSCIPICIDDDSDSDSNSRKVGETETKEVTLKDSVKAEPMEDMANPGKTEEATVKCEGNKSDSDVEMKNEEESDIEAERDSVDSKSKSSMKKEAEKSISVKERDESEDEDNEDNNDADGNDDNDENSDGVNNDDDDGGEDGGDHPMDVDDEPQERKDKDKKDSARPRRSNRSADSKSAKRDSEDVLSDDDDSKGKGSLRSKKGKGEKKKGSETTPKSKDKHRTEKEKKSKKSAQEKEEDSDCETEKTKTKSSSRKKSNREKSKKENVTDEEEDGDCETEKTKTKSSSRKQSNREKSKKENVTDEEEDSDCKTEKTQTKSSSRKKSKEKRKKENVTDEEGDSDCETEKTKTKSSSRKKSKEKSKKENVTDEEDDSECETEKTKTKSTSPKKSKEKSKKENVTDEEDDSDCETEKTKTKSTSPKKSKEKSKKENITDEDEGSDSGNKKKDKEDEEIEEEVSKPKALSKSKSVDSENVAAQLELLKEMADELSEMNRKNEEEEGDGKDDDKGDVEENGDDDVGDDMDDDVEDNIDDDLEEKEDVEENEDEDVEENKDVDVENKDVAESDSDTKVTKGKGKGKKSKVSAKESKSGKKGKAKDADESKDKTEKESKKKKKKSVEESTDEKSSKGKTKKEPADEKKKGQKNDQDNSSSSSDDDTDSSDEDVTRKRRKPRKTSSKKEKEPAVKKERAVKKEQKKRSSKRNAAKEESIKVQTESDSENFDSDLEKDIKTLEKDTRVQKCKSKKGEKESTKKSSSKEKEKKKSKKKGKDDDESLSSGTDKENEDEVAEDEEQDDDDKTEDEDYTEKIKKLKESEKKDDQEEDMEEDESEDNDDNADEEEDDDTDEVSFPKLALAKKGKKKAASDVSGSDSDPAPKKKKISNNLLDAKLSDSDSDFQTPKKKRKRPDKERGKRKRKHSSDESEEEEKEEDDDDDDEEEEDDEEDEESESGSGSGSGSDGGKKKKKKKKKKKGKGKRSYAKSKGKKRRRIKKMESSEDEKERGEGDVLSGDEEEEDEDDETTPGGGFMKRKKIRKVQKNKKLTDETKAARKAEEERRKRIEERQKEINVRKKYRFNSYVEVEAQVDEEELPEGVEREAASTDAVNNFQGPHKKVPVTTKLILEKDKEKKKDLIMVDSTLIKKLKPHQVDAVRFMYNCLVESLDRIDETGAGCILAHCMGLGKTLSVISFIHTMTKHRKLTKLSKVVVVCPLNTVLNWVNEFEIWQDDLDFQMDVYELSSVKENFRRARMLEDWHKGGPGALIIGYDMYRNLTMGSHCKNKKQKKIFYETLCDPGPDIVICDEGHILKNDATSVSKAMNKVRSRRRVVLTGTPLQNNLGEYHCMVDFVKPNLLGTRKEFGNRFVNPITNGQCRDSTGFDVKLMKRRAHILHEMLAGCVQRKDYSALTKFLPPKMEYVVSVRLSKVQMQLYEKYMELSGLGAFRDISSKGARLFKDYQALMRIWTHPWVLHLDKVRQDNKVKYDDSEDSFIDDISGNETDESFFSGKSSPEVSAVEISDSDDEKRGRRRRRSSSSSGSDDDKKKAKSEIVKKWKTRSRGTDENGAGPSWADDPIIVEDDNNVGTEWWHEFVSKGDERRLEIGGKMVLLFEILKMCEEIGDKVLVFSQSLLSLDIIEDFLEKIDSVHSMADEVKKEEGKENSAGDEKSTDDKADKKDSDVTGDKKEEGSGDKIDDGSGDKKDDGSGDKKEDGSADKKEDGSADKKEDVSADKKEDGSADKKEDGSADKKDDGSADKKEDGSADKKEDGSADKKEDGSADKPAEPEDPLLRYRSSWTRGADYFRMDGSTSVQNRKAAQNMFNDEENYRARLFLISTKAGSLGINLVSANRVIIFDASWNPSHDIQSIFRVYRFGQVKPVYVYRFLAQGTMEEKIYERQVTKQSLSQRVIDEHQIERHFTSSDLQELYKFQPDRLDDPDRQPKPLPMLPKDHMLAELVSSHKEWLVTFHEHDSLLENIVGEELSEEDRKAAWEEYENEKKGLITNKVNPMMSIISNPNMGGQMYGNMGMMGGNMHMQQSNNPMMGLSQAAVMQIVQDLKMRFPNLPQDMFEQRVQAVLRQVLTQQMINQNDYQRNLERRQMEELQRLNQLKQQIQRQQNQVDAQQRGLGLSSQFSNSRMTNPSVQMQLEQARQRAAAGQKMDGRSNPKS